MQKHLKVRGKVLCPVRPNHQGLEVLYRKRLYALVDEMCRSIQSFVTA